jgi:hypothetical protein
MKINIVDNERGTVDVTLNSEARLKQYGGVKEEKRFLKGTVLNFF